MIVLDTDSSAPWNQGLNDLTATGIKKVIITLTNVVGVETSEVEEDEDEFGRYIVPSKDADWYRAYEEDEFRLSKMLDLLTDIATENAKNYKAEYDLSKIGSKERTNNYKQWQYWHEVAKHCKGWVVEDVEIEEL